MIKNQTTHAYIGTYTQTGNGGNHRKEGIYICRVDLINGKLTLEAKVESNENPSYLRLHPGKRFLYAVNELEHGKASSFAVNPANAFLTLLNSQPVDGSAPCYVSYDLSGKYMLVANYSSGNLTVFPIRADGKLDPHSDLVAHVGSGPRREQDGARAHSIAFAPGGKYVVAADLGMDRLIVYKFDEIHGKLVLNDLPGVTAHLGAGPRHFIFHPNGQILYCANELNSTVMVCSWEGIKGILAPIQVLSTLPADFSGWNAVADIHMHPDQKTLYVSNRGHNSLAIFRVANNGTLTPIGYTGSGGEIPRNFAVDPGGKWLFVANQNSNNVVTFRVDMESGIPEKTENVFEVPSPVCIELVDF
jgi:6-phosphogluconolactonase